MKGNILFVIIVIASVLRLLNLTTVPPSLSLDEVSLGYNAYSILKTASDEYGQQFPIVLRAYDDWRPALYAYLIIPFIPLFGLGTIAVRLPSVILGTLTVVLTYFFVGELFREKKHLSFSIGHLTLGIAEVASFLLAISPWHIYLSRLGHEVNAGLFFTLLTFFSLVKIIKGTNGKRWILVAALLSGVSLYTYQSQKIITPLILITFGILYLSNIRKNWKNLLISAIVFLLISFPVAYITLFGEGLVRFRGTSAFTSDNPIYQEKIIQFAKAKESGDVVGQLMHHRYLAFTQIFVSNYLSHFSPSWLFSGTSSENHKVPFTGLLYIWEIPLILLGVVYLFIVGLPRKIVIMLLVMFFVAPLPGAITTQAPHAMRSYTFLPFWQIFGALGFVFLLNNIKSRHSKYIFTLIVFSLIAASLKGFYKNYYVIFPVNQSHSFQYALSRSIQETQKSWQLYDKVVVSNENNLYQSYMFYLFWSAYDPKFYLNQGGTQSGGFAQTHAIDNIEFRPINWELDKQLESTLFIGNINDFPADISTKKTYKNKNGEEVIKIVEMRKHYAHNR